MSEQTKTCDDPCAEVLVERMRDLKADVAGFISDYKVAHQSLIDTNNNAHKEIIERVKTTNGSVAEIKIWQERANGAIVVLTGLGVITWLGKYIITFLEK